MKLSPTINVSAAGEASNRCWLSPLNPFIFTSKPQLYLSEDGVFQVPRVRGRSQPFRFEDGS